jgi:hypothetical protein
MTYHRVVAQPQPQLGGLTTLTDLPGGLRPVQPTDLDVVFGPACDQSGGFSWQEWWGDEQDEQAQS